MSLWSSVLSRLVGDILPKEDHIAISMDGGKKQNSKFAFWNAMARLSVTGIEVNFSELWQNFTFDYVYDQEATQEFVYNNTA